MQSVDPGRSRSAVLQVGAFSSIGISRLVEQDPKQRDADVLMDDAQHQNIDMAAAKFPVCTVQSKMPRLASQPHDVSNQLGDTSLIKSNILEETLKTTVDRQCLGPRIDMPRKTPQTDGSGLNNQRHQPNKRLTSCPPQRYMVC